MTEIVKLNNPDFDTYQQTANAIRKIKRIKI